MKKFNTFGLDAEATALSRVASLEELKKVMVMAKKEHSKILFLGGGSNVLFSQNFPGLVIKNEIFGKNKIDEDDESVVVEVGAGENWHQFVLWSLEQGWCGLENLSLIPGCVGAAPIQNIGAYGVEVCDFIERVDGLDLDAKPKSFSPEDCQFGYRESVFKLKLLDQFIITKVRFRLLKQPKLKLSYGMIGEELDRKGIKTPIPKDVSEVVMNIRRSKLPDPQQLGNAGSFFKNPVIEKSHYETLKMSFDQLPHYATAKESMVKVPAGWLIDKAGWKGKALGDAAVHKKQALVLVNLGQAKGTELVELSRKVQSDIYEKYQINLEPEVRIL